MNPSHFAKLPRRLCGVMLLCAGGGMQVAEAQAPAPAHPRFAPAAERARQEGDKVFMRILRDGATAKRIAPAAAPDSAAAQAPSPAPAAPPAPAAKPAASPVVAAPAPAGKPPERAVPAQRKPAVVANAPAAPASEPRPSVAVMPPTTAPESPPPQQPPAPSTHGAGATTAEPPQDDPPLVLVRQVEPEFPIAILRRQKKGGVTVRFVVQADGSVAQPEVVKSSNPYLNPYAVQAVAQWKFQPLPREQSATAELGFDLRQSLLE